MNMNRDDTEIRRLREENRSLRILLGATQNTEQRLSTSEGQVSKQAGELGKVREEALLQARLFDSILSSLVDFVYTFDRDGRFTYVNQALLGLWQIKIEDALGKNFFDLGYPEELASRLQAQIEQVFQTGQTLRDETPFTSVLGTIGYYEYIFVPVLGSDGTVEVVAGSTRDISGRHTMEADLGDARARLQSALNAGEIATWTFDIQTDSVTADKNLARLFGVSPEVAAGGPLAEYIRAIHPQDRDRVERTIHAAVISHDNYEAEYRLVQPDGHLRAVIARGRAEYDLQGIPLNMRGVVLDITERKNVEAALLHSEERFRAAVQALGDIVWTNNVAGEMEGEQASWAAFTGQSYAEYQGYGWAKAVHPEDAQPTLDAWNQTVAQREMFQFEHRLRRADGVWRLFSIRAVPVISADGNIREWVGVHSDITEEREGENEIRALNGRLRHAMTETHHRVKNNLQLISALIDLQRESGEESVSMAELARLSANVRALGVIHDILTQEAKAGNDQDTLPVKAVLERLAALLQQTIGNRSLKFAFDDVRLTSRQTTTLALVTNELVSNALKHGKGETEIDFKVAGDTASLEVCDDGPGFPEGFSAAASSNTGLELVENIVGWDLGGQITYENRCEGGARITVVFPIPNEGSGPESDL